MISLLIPVALYIAWRDLRTHTISHQSLLLLSLTLLPNYRLSHTVESAIATLVLILVGTLLRFGGGDIKLLILLTWLQFEELFSMRYLSIALLILTLHLAQLLPRDHWSNLEIPMAPTILLPILAIHLGI